jgi:hypothetical protein
MAGQPLGQLLDSLGVTHEPDDGELIASAFVLLRVIDPDGTEAVRYAKSDGMSWVEIIGMLEVARHCKLVDLREEDDDEDR